MTFEQYIDDAFFQENSYEKMRHQLLHVRQKMSIHKSFSRQSVKAQFEQCVTILIIATQSQTDVIHNIRILRKPETKEFPYSIDYKFKPKDVLPIEGSAIKQLEYGKQD